MPEGVEPAQHQAEPSSSTPLDGLVPPFSERRPRTEGAEAPSVPPNRRKVLLLALAIGGGFLLFYLIFAFVLMAQIPSPDGGKQGLRLFGNVFYIATSVLFLLGFCLIAARMLRGGLSTARLLVLVRPAILVVAIAGIAGMVVYFINQEHLLPPIDILEPKDQQALTAPLTITFGTETIRSFLKNQSLFPQRYKWDFNGDGTFDTEMQEHEVTTVYKKKGTYNIHLLVLLTDGTVRSAFRRITIATAVFVVTPQNPIVNEEMTVSVADLVANPETVERVLWDFNGDGEMDVDAPSLTTKHTYTVQGTYQAQVTIQLKSGVQETYLRPIIVLQQRPQPFEVSLEAEGSLKGSAPLGLIFRARTAEGVRVKDVRWSFLHIESGREETALGERVSHAFVTPGQYRITVEVVDAAGRIAQDAELVTVLEPLDLKDVTITGDPKPKGEKVEGTAPLSIRLSASTPTPFITFKWEQENASRVFSSGQEFHALYNDPGAYPVVLIATDAEGRVQRISLMINVLPPRSRIVFTAIPSTGLAPLTVTFDASQSSIPEKRITGFAWTFGDEEDRGKKAQLLGAQVTHRYENEGTYTAVVRALTEDGQSYEERKTIVVRSPMLDACVFPSRSVGSAPLGVRFDASCSTGRIQNYRWDFGDQSTSEQTTPVQDHVFLEAGTYTVRLEVLDGEGNVSATSVSITVR